MDRKGKRMGGGMRAVRFAAIVMGVLIVLGTTVVLVTIMKRTMFRGEMAASGDVAREAPRKNFAAVLDEPAGTGVAGIAAVRDRLAIQLRGGGTDRVLFIDPETGAVVGRVTLSR
jgi:Na+(H+)/acetate symporter ActP